MGFTVVVERRFVINAVLNWVSKSNESLKFWLWCGIGRERSFREVVLSGMWAADDPCGSVSPWRDSDGPGEVLRSDQPRQAA